MSEEIEISESKKRDNSLSGKGRKSLKKKDIQSAAKEYIITERKNKSFYEIKGRNYLGNIVDIIDKDKDSAYLTLLVLNGIKVEE